MKVIKPQRLGLLSRAWEYRGEFFFTVSIMAFFPFESPSLLLPEVRLWQLLSKELGKDVIFDEAMPKPSPELLVTGNAYTPRGTPLPVCAVRARLGSVDKRLCVVGDRVWTLGGPSEPTPFTQMPITWSRSFGGKGFAQNPLGKGYARIRDERGRETQPLPNIETPGRLVKSPNDRPDPAGFGAYDITWPQRFKKFGTYDQRWLEQRFPGFADDADVSLFNVAPEDQRYEGELRGDEPFEIENMHPENPRISSRLPGVRGRCFITQKTKGGEIFREIHTRIDTVHMLPNALRGVVIFRGTTTVNEDDAADVTNLVICAEQLDGPSRSIDHYRDVLAARLDKQKGALLSLKDADLMPPGDAPEVKLVDEKGSDMDELVATKGLLEKNLRNRMSKEVDKVRAELAAMGVDPEAHLPKQPERQLPPSLEKLSEYVESLEPMIDDAKRQADTMVAKAKADLKETYEKAGLDEERMRAKVEKSGGGPPKFSAEKEMNEIRRAREHMKAARIEVSENPNTPSDDEIERRLRAAEQELMRAYQTFAHLFPEAEAPEGEAAAALREAVVEAHRNGTSLKGRDLTGVDLSNLDLSGIDLEHALLECANFCGANLSGASLKGAVLARANLTRANLDGASLLGANLGRAILERARLTGGIDLEGATLMYADLSGASFDGAKLDRVDMYEARFKGASFRDVRGAMLNFVQSDLSGVSFAGAELIKCNFIETTLDEVDFSGATMTQSVFVGSRGERVKWRTARAENVRVVKESAFPGADFMGAMLDRSNFRGANLEGAELSGASLNGADFSECNMKKVKLYRATAIGALFIRADLSDAHGVSMNLMEAILQKANLSGADFRGANLFRADLARCVGDERTSFEDALVDQVRHVAARKKGNAA
jgi:uncharacterized protein YjbI with pentapeptide repeats